MYLKDPNTKLPSPTLTIMIVGVGTLLLKLLLSGAEWNGIKMGELSGSEFAFAIAPLLALYGHKRQVRSQAEKANSNNEQRDD